MADDTAPSDHRQRERATDPTRSVIAQAPAGSGKTTLLVTRYLHLLAIVERPEEILAITFTRKAAGEMRTRILEALTRSEDPIATTVRERSSRLGWGLPEHSGRLRVQTIDGFAAMIVRSLPAAAGLGPNLRLEERPTWAYRRAVENTLARIAAVDDPLADDIANLLGDFDDRFEYASGLLVEMLARRDQWFEPLLMGFRGPRPLQALLRAGRDELVTQVRDDVLTQLRDAERSELADLARVAANHLGHPWPEHGLPNDPHGWRRLAAMFSTDDGRLRQRFTQAQGFPPGPSGRALKARATALLDGIRGRGLDSLFAAALRLPIEVPEDDGLRRVATVLSLAAVELTRVFESEGSMDFTELTLAARRALGSDEAPTDLALALDYRIRHLLVDEFQDTSVAHFRLFRQLVAGWQPGDGRTFFAVGDPMQSVYRFRDADVALFAEVARHGIGALRPELVHLTTNFRASAELVDWTNRCFARAFGRASDPVIGQIPYTRAEPARGVSEEPAIHVDAAPRPYDEAGWLAQRISALQQALAERDPTQTMALLVRSRRQLPELLAALGARGVRWQGTDIRLLADEPAVVDLLSLLHALYDPADRLHWLAFARCPLVGLKLRDLEVLAQGSASVGHAVLSFDPEAPSALSDDAIKRLTRVQPILTTARAQLGTGSTRRWLENTWLRLGGTSAYSGPTALPAAERFLILLEADFARRVDLTAIRAAAAELYAEDMPSDAPPPVLQVLTIHRAKGLEFDHVFLPGLERPAPTPEPSLLLWRATDHGLLLGTAATDTYRWLRFEERERDRNEQLRLLYVACTRARRSLHLSMAGANSDGTVTVPSPTSLLRRLWDVLDTPVVQPSLNEERSPTGTSEAPPLERLPNDYCWHAPVDWPDLRVSGPLTLPERVGSAAPEHRYEIALGTVLHDALRALGSQLPDEVEPYLEHVRPHWIERLKELGLAQEGVDEALAELCRQLRVTLADTDGRWVLGPRRAGESEAPFTALLDGALVNVVVDRTFLDEDGARWIVDFKSSRPLEGQSTDSFVAEQLSRHATQLRRYQRVLAAFGDDQPVRAALYFTAIGRMEKLPSVRPSNEGAA